MEFASENITRKVDSLGRVSIPKNIRARLSINDNDEVEVGILHMDTRDWVCFGGKPKPIGRDSLERYQIAADVLKELGFAIPQRLLNKIIK